MPTHRLEPHNTRSETNFENLLSQFLRCVKPFYNHPRDSLYGPFLAVRTAHLSSSETTVTIWQTDSCDDPYSYGVCSAPVEAFNSIVDRWTVSGEHGSAYLSLLTGVREADMAAHRVVTSILRQLKG